MIDLLRRNGPFRKANLHSHTTKTDGRMTALEVKEWYKEHGYEIVAFTDHSVYFNYPELKDEHFLPIAGVETDFCSYDPDFPQKKMISCHINFWQECPESPLAVYVPETHEYRVDTINAYIEAMKKNGFYCCLNHPGWSMLPGNDIEHIDGLDAVEVYNHGAEWNNNCGNGNIEYAMYLNSGHRAWAIAADDNHAGIGGKDIDLTHDDDTLGGWIEISMPALTVRHFFEAFRNGSFYATQGPKIYDYYIDENRDKIVVRCSPVKNISIKGNHIGLAAHVNSNRNDITYAEFPLAGIRETNQYFRLEIWTTDMKRAFSQPYYFELKPCRKTEKT